MTRDDVAIIYARVDQIHAALTQQSVPLDKHTALALVSLAGITARLTGVPRAIAAQVVRTFFEDEPPAEH